MGKKILGGLAFALAATLVSLPAPAADDEAPKMKTKQIMKEGFKGGLLKKVAGGSASAEDAKKLHEMLVALSKNEPPKGEAESWKTLTTALVKASQGVVDGDKDAGAALQKAANCKACHKNHKP